MQRMHLKVQSTDVLLTLIPCVTCCAVSINCMHASVYCSVFISWWAWALLESLSVQTHRQSSNIGLEGNHTLLYSFLCVCSRACVCARASFPFTGPLCGCLSAVLSAGRPPLCWTTAPYWHRAPGTSCSHGPPATGGRKAETGAPDLGRVCLHSLFSPLVILELLWAGH